MDIDQIKKECKHHGNFSCNQEQLEFILQGAILPNEGEAPEAYLADESGVSMWHIVSHVPLKERRWNLEEYFVMMYIAK